MTASVLSVADVRTDRPARYAKQLVAHLTRRATGEWSEEAGSGWLEFEGGRAELAALDGVLQLRLTAEAPAVDRLEDVLGRHLVRFGARDELLVSWTRSDGSAGTEQRNQED